MHEVEGDALRPLQLHRVPTHAEHHMSPPGTGGGPGSIWEEQGDTRCPGAEGGGTSAPCKGLHLALDREGARQVGVSSSMVGYGGGGKEGQSEGHGLPPGGMLCLVPAGDRLVKVVSIDPMLLFSPQPLGFRVNFFCN